MDTLDNPEDAVPDLDAQELKHVATLTRRAEHLFGKMDQRPDYPGKSYDLKEYQALSWVLDELEVPLTTGAPSRCPDEEDVEPEPPRVPLRRVSYDDTTRTGRRPQRFMPTNL